MEERIETFGTRKIIRIALEARNPGKGSCVYLLLICMMQFHELLLSKWPIFPPLTLFYEVSRLLSRNRLAALKAHQTTQADQTQILSS